MTKTSPESNIKAKNILKSRSSILRLPHEAIKSDTLISFVKNELDSFNESNETFDITFDENSSTIIFNNKTLDNLNLTINTSTVSLKNKTIDKKTRRHSFPLMKKTSIDPILITPSTKKKIRRLKSVGIPKLHRSFVQSLKKIVTPKTPETFNNITVRRYNHNKNFNNNRNNNDDVAIPTTPQKNNANMSIDEARTPVQLINKFDDKNLVVKNLNGTNEMNSSFNISPVKSLVNLSQDLSINPNESAVNITTNDSPPSSPVNSSNNLSVDASPSKSPISFFKKSLTIESPTKPVVDSSINGSPTKLTVDSSDNSSGNDSPAKSSIVPSVVGSPVKSVTDLSNGSLTDDSPAKSAVDLSDKSSDKKSTVKSPIKSLKKSSINSSPVKKTLDFSNNLLNNVSPAESLKLVVDSSNNSSTNDSPAKKDASLFNNKLNNISPAKSITNSLINGSPTKPAIFSSDDSSIDDSPAKKGVSLSNNNSPAKSTTTPLTNGNPTAIYSSDESSIDDSPAKKGVSLSNNNSPAKSITTPLTNGNPTAIHSSDDSSIDDSPAKTAKESFDNSLNNVSPAKSSISSSNDTSTNDSPAKEIVSSSNNLLNNISPVESPMNPSMNSSPSKAAGESSSINSTAKSLINSSNDSSTNLSKNISPAKSPMNTSKNSSINGSPTQISVNLPNNFVNNGSPAKSKVITSNNLSINDSPAKLVIDSSTDISPTKSAVNLLNNSSIDPAKSPVDSSKNLSTRKRLIEKPVDSSPPVSPVKPSGNSPLDLLINSTPAKLPVDTSKDSTTNINSVKKNSIKNIHKKILNSNDNEKLLLTPKNTLNRSFNSDTEYEKMCETLKENDYQPTSFTFETVELLDTFQESEKIDLDDKVLAGMTTSIKSKINNNIDFLKDPLSTEPIFKKPKLSSTLLTLNKNTSDYSDNMTEYEIESPIKNIKKNKKLIKRKKKSSIKKENYQDDNDDDDDDNNNLKKINNVYNDSNDENNSPKKNTNYNDSNDENNSPKINTNYNDSNDENNLTKTNTNYDESIDENKENNTTNLSSKINDESHNDSNDHTNNKTKENFPISDETIEKLRHIVVELEHEVPKQHEIGTSCSLPLTKKEKLQFKKYEVLKSGAFTRKEDNIIKKNWQRFCDIHFLIINNERFFSKRYNGHMFIKEDKERKKFVQFLARGLVQRPLFNVFKRFERLYEYRKREEIKSKRYTPDEDKTIIKYFEQKKPAISKSIVLPKILNRPYDSIHRRYFYLRKKLNLEKKNDESMRGIQWTLQLIKKYIKNLLNLTLSSDIMELKDAFIPSVVWEKMEEKMNINWKTLRYFWLHQLHMQLYCKNEIYLNDIKIMLTKYLYKKKITNQTKINWPHVVKYFDGYTKDFLSETLHRMKLENKEQMKLSYADRRLSFGKFVNDLHQIQINNIKYKKNDRFLPRLSYNNGTVEIIDDSSDIIPKLEQSDDDDVDVDADDEDINMDDY